MHRSLFFQSLGVRDPKFEQHTCGIAARQGSFGQSILDSSGDSKRVEKTPNVHEIKKKIIEGENFAKKYAISGCSKGKRAVEFMAHNPDNQKLKLVPTLPCNTVCSNL